MGCPEGEAVVTPGGRVRGALRARRAVTSTWACTLLAALMIAAVLAALPAPAAAATEPAPSAIAAANGRTEPQIQRILADPAARVGEGNRIFFADPVPADPPAAAAPEAAGPFPDADTFRLHSRPGSSRVIYLDFDGHTVVGTAWNAYASRSTIVAEAMSLDGSPAFNEAEMDIVQSVWQRVAEDYAIFDVDVTTEDPGPDAITRSGEDDQRYGTRALITDTSAVADVCGCLGVAYLSNFDDPATHARYQPAFVFSRPLGHAAKGIAEATSHEVGHNLGLLHDGTGISGYYRGHGSWVPIMGFSVDKPISQWSRGEYPGANNPEDDVATMQATGAPLLADDHGDTAAEATALDGGPTVRAAGVITTDADVDVFRVEGVGASATFSASPAATGPNLDLLLELRSADATVLASNDPPSATVSADRATGLGASVTAELAAGESYFLSASGVGAGTTATGYSGYGSLGRYTLTASLNAPTVTLVSSSNPSDAGQEVRFTASVVAPPAAGTPTGTVTFTDGDTILCPAVPLAADTAGCTAALDAGERVVTATYGGDATFGQATSAGLSQTVIGAPTVVAVTSSPADPTAGQALTFEATVSPQPPGAGTPTGTVTFNDGATPLCSAVVLSSGVASCSRSLTAGSHPVTVVYGGDARFAGATSPALTVTVSQASTVVTLATSANPSPFGTYVTLTATVAPVAPATGTPTGRVTFNDGATPICRDFRLYLGKATCSLYVRPAGHALTAVYAGDASHAAATSAVLTQSIVPRPTTVAVSGYPAPSVAGQEVTFRARVTPDPYSSSVTGRATFTIAGAPVCADVLVTYGEATCRTSPAIGSHAVIAVYAGDTGFLGSTSPPLGHVVGQANTNVWLSASPYSPAVGEAVTLTATVSPATSTTEEPTGTVRFSSGATVLCGGATLEDRKAVCVAAFEAGSHALTADYSGNAAFSVASSWPYTLRVGKSPVTIAVSSSANPSVTGQPVQLRAIATPSWATPPGSPPGGTMTFGDAAAPLCVGVAVIAGEATCSTSLPPGNYSVPVVYSGDTRFSGATSTPLTQTVARAWTAVTLTSSSNPVRGHVPLSLTALVTVTAPGSGVPVGAVTFAAGPTVLCPSVPLTDGRATCVPAVTEGSYPIRAIYNGGTQLEPSSSPVLDQTIWPGGATFVAVTPARLLDTRSGIGGPAGPIGGSLTRQLRVRGGTTGIPESATAVVLNTTVISPSAAGFLTVYPSDVPTPETSNLTFAAGQTIPNLVTTGVGADGTVSIFSPHGRAHVAADVVGYYVASGGDTFTAMTPARLLDTRIGTGGPVGPGATRELVVRGGTTGVPADATAVVLNTTVTAPSAAGYLTVFPSGVARPPTSNLNFVAGQTIPNLVVTGIGTDGRISLFNAVGSAHVIADVVGYYTRTGGSTFLPVTPARLLDTRSGIGGPATALGPGFTRELAVRGGSTGIPDDVTAVVLNTAAVLPSAAGYLTVYPSGVSRPTASNLNFVPGQVVSNLVVARVGADGRISIFNDAGTVHVVADVVGYMV